MFPVLVALAVAWKGPANGPLDAFTSQNFILITLFLLLLILMRNYYMDIMVQPYFLDIYNCLLNGYEKNTDLVSGFLLVGSTVSLLTAPTIMLVYSGMISQIKNFYLKKMVIFFIILMLLIHYGLMAIVLLVM